MQDVLAARVDRLPEEPRRVLQTASVLGREFPLRLLERVWDGAAPVGPQLTELTRLEFIHELQGVDERVFVFKHALTQDVAYDGLLTSRRKRLHEAAGAALEELYAGRLEEAYDRLAYHYSQTDRSDKAVHYLDRFAERAVRTYAHAEAAKALREALVHVERLPADERERRAVDLVLRLVNSLYFLGRFGESLDLLLDQEAAVERIGDPWLSGPFSMWLGHTYTHAGDSEGAARSIERAVAEAEGVGDLATIGKSHYVMAREGFWLGNLAEGAEHGRRAVAALSRTGDWWWLAHSYCWTALNLCNLGRFEEALAEVARARAIGAERADPRIHSYSAWNAGWIQATRGEWEAAIADCTESLETSPDSLNSSYSMGWLGFSYREKGDMGEAIRHLERSIALLTEFRYSRLIAWFKAWLSEAHLCAGDAGTATETARRALSLSEQVGYPWAVAVAQRALGRAALTTETSRPRAAASTRPARPSAAWGAASSLRWRTWTWRGSSRPSVRTQMQASSWTRSRRVERARRADLLRSRQRARRTAGGRPGPTVRLIARALSRWGGGREHAPAGRTNRRAQPFGDTATFTVPSCRPAIAA